MSRHRNNTDERRVNLIRGGRIKGRGEECDSREGEECKSRERKGCNSRGEVVTPGENNMTLDGTVTRGKGVWFSGKGRNCRGKGCDSRGKGVTLGGSACDSMCNSRE